MIKKPMTHGEAWFLRKQNTQLNDFDNKRKRKENLPQAMPRAEAGKYYNTKFYAYWMDEIDDRFTIAEKKSIVGNLMFRKNNYKKIFKESSKCGF